MKNASWWHRPQSPSSNRTSLLDSSIYVATGFYHLMVMKYSKILNPAKIPRAIRVFTKNLVLVCSVLSDLNNVFILVINFSLFNNKIIDTNN